MSPAFFTATGTDVGKTLTLCGLTRAAIAQGRAPDLFKPVSSGFDPAEPAASDAGRLLAALGLAPTPQAIDAIAPLRFAAPLSPPDAAEREDAFLAMAHIEALCRARIDAAGLADRLLLIEGAGGLMSPIASDGLNLDLILHLGLPSVLCAANYLGTISHILTALAVMRQRGAPVLAVVVHDLAPGGPALTDTMRALRLYAPEAKVIAGDGWEEDLLAALTGGG